MLKRREFLAAAAAIPMMPQISSVANAAERTYVGQVFNLSKTHVGQSLRD